jgi:LPLT family lysophospholipid transporter-like MFS transporter
MASSAFGAAAYSPAKYGILTELLPPDRLVAANGWIEGTTVGSIILGTVLGGALISPHIAAPILNYHIPTVNTPAEAAMLVIMAIYVIAALFNLRIPDTGARYPQNRNAARSSSSPISPTVFSSCGATSSVRSRLP